MFDAVLQDEDLSLTLSQLVETKRGVITVVSEALALLGMTPFIYIEICTVLEYGPKRWLSIWNLMDLATYFLQVCNIINQSINQFMFCVLGLIRGVNRQRLRVLSLNETSRLMLFWGTKNLDLHYAVLLHKPHDLPSSNFALMQQKRKEKNRLHLLAST